VAKVGIIARDERGHMVKEVHIGPGGVTVRKVPREPAPGQAPAAPPTGAPAPPPPVEPE
jgi:hypothetical protein